MNRSIATRLSNLERQTRPTIRIPHVWHMKPNETRTEAVARFCTQYVGNIPTKHGLLILPPREDAETFARKFKAQQTGLITLTRSGRQKETEPCQS